MNVLRRILNARRINARIVKMVNAERLSVLLASERTADRAPQTSEPQTSEPQTDFRDGLYSWTSIDTSIDSTFPAVLANDPRDFGANN